MNVTHNYFDTSTHTKQETNRQYSPTVRTFVISGSPGATGLRTARTVLSEGRKSVQLFAMD